jgi:hypothetical protein
MVLLAAWLIWVQLSLLCAWLQPSYCFHSARCLVVRFTGAQACLFAADAVWPSLRSASEPWKSEVSKVH